MLTLGESIVQSGGCCQVTESSEHHNHQLIKSMLYLNRWGGDCGDGEDGGDSGDGGDVTTLGHLSASPHDQSIPHLRLAKITLSLSINK